MASDKLGPYNRITASRNRSRPKKAGGSAGYECQTETSEYKLLSRLFFRLLPYQILLIVINAVNGIVDSLYASNAVGKAAMSAIGAYSPINHFRGVFNDFGMFGNFGADVHPSGITDSADRNRGMPPFADQFMQRQGMFLADAAFSLLSDIHYLAMLHDQRLSGVDLTKPDPLYKGK